MSSNIVYDMLVEVSDRLHNLERKGFNLSDDEEAMWEELTRLIENCKNDHG